MVGAQELWVWNLRIALLEVFIYEQIYFMCDQDLPSELRSSTPQKRVVTRQKLLRNFGYYNGHYFDFL